MSTWRKLIVSKVILSDGQYRQAGEGVQILDHFPPMVYDVEYAPPKSSETPGLYLVPSHMSLYSGQLYGDVYTKVDNLFALYDYTNRSQGAIMSGPRGTGKTIMCKVAIARALERDMAVLVVTKPYPGLVKFINSIAQPIAVLFDEFEKIFPRGYSTMMRDENDSDGSGIFGATGMSDRMTTQAEMLGMFDGTASTYLRIWLITCNNVNLLDENLVNRPGRFYYHFRFPHLKSTTITQVLKARIPKSMYKEIPKVVQFAETVYPLNYDCLNAIAIGLERGVKFEEVVADLNVIPTGYLQFKVVILFSGGEYSDPATVYVKASVFATRKRKSDVKFVTISVHDRRLTTIGLPLKQLVYNPELKCYMLAPNTFPPLKDLPPGFNPDAYQFREIRIIPELDPNNLTQSFHLDDDD